MADLSGRLRLPHNGLRATRPLQTLGDTLVRRGAVTTKGCGPLHQNDLAAFQAQHAAGKITSKILDQDTIDKFGSPSSYLQFEGCHVPKCTGCGLQGGGGSARDTQCDCATQRWDRGDRGGAGRRTRSSCRPATAVLVG